MTVELTLSDSEAEHLADLIQRHGAVKATERALAQRRNLLSRDQAISEIPADRVVALVAVKLSLAQLEAQKRDQAAAHECAHIGACGLPEPSLIDHAIARDRLHRGVATSSDRELLRADGYPV